MMKFALPLALVLVAGGAVACPDSDKMKSASVGQSPTVTAGTSDADKRSKVVADKKSVKPAEVKKATT